MVISRVYHSQCHSVLVLCKKGIKKGRIVIIFDKQMKRRHKKELDMPAKNEGALSEKLDTYNFQICLLTYDLVMKTFRKLDSLTSFSITQPTNKLHSSQRH